MCRAKQLPCCFHPIVFNFPPVVYPSLLVVFILFISVLSHTCVFSPPFYSWSDRYTVHSRLFLGIRKAVYDSTRILEAIVNGVRTVS